MSSFNLVDSALDYLNLGVLRSLVGHVLDDFRREPRLALTIAVLTFVIAYLLYLVTQKSYDPKKEKGLSKKEEDELIAEWQPQPLCPPLPDSSVGKGEQKQSAAGSGFGKGPLLDTAPEAYVTADGKKLTNLLSYNFLNLASHPAIKEACAKTIVKYGVGACGPRGFYGSIDVHIDLEKEIAKFMGVPYCILYSDGFSTISSALPPFCKKGDLILLDDGVNFAMQTGAKLTRSNIVTFRHNDMKDLEAKLQEIQAKDAKRGKKKPYPRFIAVEGLSQYHGDVCPLNEVVQLAQKYRYRLFLDDTMAIGVLGKTGRGSIEHWGLKMSDVDLICGSLDASLAAVGGFCVSTNEHAISHQRLSGAGYCFSAASPPYCSTAGITTLQLIDKQPELCASLRQKAERFRSELTGIRGLAVDGSSISPIVHVRLAHPAKDAAAEADTLQRIVDTLVSSDVLADLARYIPGDQFAPRPSIRMFVTAGHDDKDLLRVAETIKFAAKTMKL